MKGSELFKKTIEDYLLQKALIDPLFEEKFKKPNKNIDDCIAYILNTVQKSGENGLTDDEVYGMAIHYYDEDDITVDAKKGANMRVVVNHHVELSEQEKKEAYEKAKQKAEEDAYKKITGKDKKKTKPVEQPKLKIVEQTLF